VLLPLADIGLGLGCGGSGNPTIGGARDDGRREAECEECVLSGTLFGGAMLWDAPMWLLEGEKNGVGGRERVNEPP
jgi:hypothetical protein